jgi:hypothetical protein
VGFIKDKGILQAAAGIFGVEARHAPIIGLLLGQPAKGGVFPGVTETPQNENQVLAQVQPLLAAGNQDAQGAIPVGAPDTGAGGVASDTTGAVMATTGGVLVCCRDAHRTPPNGRS